MIAERNHRVHLILDPSEAEAIEHLLTKPPRGLTLELIILRLQRAMRRAQDKGAKFSKLR